MLKPRARPADAITMSNEMRELRALLCKAGTSAERSGDTATYRLILEALALSARALADGHDR